MAIVEKANGSLRICIDPQPLNVALKRHFKLLTFDKTIPKLANAKIFSRLDVESAFWHVKLDEASSDLTTMTTPFGCYRLKRLPFGLKVSSEIFQKRFLQALEGLSGVKCVGNCQGRPRAKSCTSSTSGDRGLRNGGVSVRHLHRIIICRVIKMESGIAAAPTRDGGKDDSTIRLG